MNVLAMYVAESGTGLDVVITMKNRELSGAVNGPYVCNGIRNCA